MMLTTMRHIPPQGIEGQFASLLVMVALLTSLMYGQTDFSIVKLSFIPL